MATKSNAESNRDGKHDVSAIRVASGSVDTNKTAENSPPDKRLWATSVPATERIADSDSRQPEIDSRSSGLWGWLLGEVPSAILVFAVRGYQVLLGPFLGGHCRFQPTCSHYFIGAVKKHGPWRGAWRGTLRVLRCHPFRPGGYDPP
jgi:putative membrane protein insertion efficiency factor